MHFLPVLLFVVLPLFASPAFSQIQRFDPVKTRELLEHVGRNPLRFEFQAVGEFSSPQARRFFEYFVTEIVPDYVALGPCSSKLQAIDLMTDLGMYRDQRELRKWKRQRNACSKKLNAFYTSEAFTEKLRIWAQLSQGLTGEMAEEARRDYQERVKWAFAPDQQDLLNELHRLEADFLQAQATVKATENLAEVESENDTAVKHFQMGRISFDEAHAILAKNLTVGGSHVVGYQAHNKLPKHLGRMAVIRSLLAKSKGYPTWAAYMLANDDGYDERYRGIEAQRDYLHRLLADLSPRIRKYLDQRITQLNLDPARVTASFEKLVHPENVHALNDFFPKEGVTDLWLQTMKESGFRDETLAQILVDDEVRPNKVVNGAYNARIYSPHLDVIPVEAATLDYVKIPRESPLWKPGLSYIMQSYLFGGHDDVEVMFHESGHALEGLLKDKQLSDAEAYAYVETPSTLMEYFLQDPEWLHAKLSPHRADRPSLEQIRQLVQNGKFALADNWHLLAQRALIETDLWDYDYSQPGAQTFIERLEMLYRQTEERALEKADPTGSIPQFFNRVGTSHHVNGSVRYIGYVFADLSTRQMIQFVSDELERRTGRRSWLNQPLLASILDEQFYTQGWKWKFPENIERITGRAFDPKVLTEEFFADINCESILAR